MTDHTDAYNSSCTEQIQVTLNVGSYGSIKIPINKCSYTHILEDFNAHSGGIDWDGHTTQQLKLDFGMALVTNHIEPIMADYAWMEVCDALTSATCRTNPSQYLVRKDSGW